MSIFMYINLQSPLKRVVRILLNSLLCWSSKTFNDGLHHSKVHKLIHSVTFIFFFGDRVQLKLYKGTPSDMYMSSVRENLFNIYHFCCKMLSNRVINLKNNWLEKVQATQNGIRRREIRIPGVVVSVTSHLECWWLTILSCESSL